MGGCRCTYRNCTVKSDGKTHMFHYPVFEKVRCHQWLINAHRLEFLNLKVSQLKNRVVCQHHFRDENFMNFKKDKLTFDAIPTEDGPYCDTTNYVDLNHDSSKLFSIIIDDIENDYNDKKANYSIKYGDFLANLDLMDIEKFDEDSISCKNNYNSNTVINSNSLNVLSPNKGRDKSKLFSEDNSFLFNISLPDKSEKKSILHPTLAVSPYMGGTDVVINNSQNYLQSTSKGKHIPAVTKNNVLVGNEFRNVINKSIQQNQEVIKKEPKVRILSEKKVIDPVPITGKFEPVSPNFVLNVSKKRKVTSERVHNMSTSKCIEKKENCMQDPNNIIEIEISPIFQKEANLKPQPYVNSINLLHNTFKPETSPSTVANPQPYISSVNVTQNTFESEKSPKMLRSQQYHSSGNRIQNTVESEKSPKMLRYQQYHSSGNRIQNTVESDKSPKMLRSQQYHSSGNRIQNTVESEKSPKMLRSQQFHSSGNRIQNTVESEKSPKMLRSQQYHSSGNLIQNTVESEKSPKMLRSQQYHSSGNLIQNTVESEKSPKMFKPQQYISSENLPQNIYDSEKSPKMSIIKPKVPPERVEAINKKREFNMKLRDMVESCLDQLDNCDKPKEKSKPKDNTKTILNKRKVRRITKLSKNTPILSTQEYTIAFLEARMRKMENTLLEKIDQNSRKINDLKNTFLNIPAEHKYPAQTKADEEAQKKHLFQEIAKYLSPSSKSLIYEELFINKFALNEPTTSSSHKRRRRK